MVTAELNNYRQSPRKVRFVADAIRGKKVSDAMDILTLVTRRSAFPLKKLLASAVANAKHNHKLEGKDLYITDIRVNEGVTYHRMMPRARGSGAPIRKRTSRIRVVLDTKDARKATNEERPKADNKPSKKAEIKSSAKKSTTKKITAKK